MKKILLLLMLFAAMLTSCRTQKNVIPSEPVVVTDTDSIKVEYIEKVVIDTVTVFVEVPAQSASNLTPDGQSHLETDFAKSDAWINPDGTLGHNLFNKPQKIASEVQVPHKTTENNISKEKVKEIPIPYPVNVYVEKDLTKWQQFRIDAFWYLIGIITLAVGWLFRKPLISMISAKR